MISTVRGTGNVTAVRRIVDIAKRIDVLEPDAAPLTQLTKKIEKKVAINPEYKWLEEEALVKTDTVNYSTGYTAGASSIAVDTGSRFRAAVIITRRILWPDTGVRRARHFCH